MSSLVKLTSLVVPSFKATVAIKPLSSLAFVTPSNAKPSLFKLALTSAAVIMIVPVVSGLLKVSVPATSLTFAKPVADNLYVYEPASVPSGTVRTISELSRLTVVLVPSDKVTLAVNPLASLALVFPSYGKLTLLSSTVDGAIIVICAAVPAPDTTGIYPSE